jgi:hypothetical protein
VAGERREGGMIEIGPNLMQTINEIVFMAEGIEKVRGEEVVCPRTTDRSTKIKTGYCKNGCIFTKDCPIYEALKGE